ncbi:Purine nucleoside phosphorylase DeoD-type [Zancudomyces culisetae]|uniref:Purine nucleoside phosphorylase DeoD-type n=1 Tax=Zancudomyces culisetae TaxID=1213189 RepID=A0A1R1PY82_ZANCU|nr:Purine nucleoside phosphorylase DeoD-type [Zancudomyces culisetae]|eukprot:OMH85902.1 Purine nucleoside phosphorylase DeoD-type [Zancudomyces culisetae]
MPVSAMSDANFPVDDQGRTYHVECKHGDIANRLVTVGDPARARLMAKKFDKIVFEHSSHRGFLIITGIYRGVPITVVSIGMGLSMMDFFVREVRAVVDGPLVIIRFGSCGSICDAQPGNIIVADSAYGIMRNYDHFTNPAKKNEEPYIITDKVPADSALTKNLTEKLKGFMGGDKVFVGANGCADSFYGSQGRLGSHFRDENTGLIQRLKKTYSDAVSLEMEAHMLYHLAAASTDGEGNPTIRAACAIIVFAGRNGNTFITPEQSVIAVENCTKSIFETLYEDNLGGAELHPTEGSVWEHAV